MTAFERHTLLTHSQHFLSTFAPVFTLAIPLEMPHIFTDRRHSFFFQMKENCQIPEVNTHVNSKHGDFFQVVQTVRLQYTRLDFKRTSHNGGVIGVYYTSKLKLR